MARKVLGVVAGLVAWAIIATAAGFIMRLSWPAYASVASAMTFTLPMLVARLLIGAVATTSTGFVTALVARSIIARLIAGLLLLVLFIPQHVMLWDKFPLWYHLTFLLSLVPLSYAGGHIAERQWSAHVSQSARVQRTRPP
jgi:hypothetical protein